MSCSVLLNFTGERTFFAENSVRGLVERALRIVWASTEHLFSLDCSCGNMSVD